MYIIAPLETSAAVPAGHHDCSGISAAHRRRGAVSEDVPVRGGRAASRARSASIRFPIAPVSSRSSRASCTASAGAKRHAPEVLAAQLRSAAAIGRFDDSVPVPLTAAVWSDAVFRARSRRTRSRRRDPRRPAGGAALPRAGGARRRDAASISPTIRRAHADLRARRRPFAAFANSLRVHANRVVPPGGDAAVPLWEAVVGERVTRPDRFRRGAVQRRTKDGSRISTTPSGSSMPPRQRVRARPVDRGSAPRASSGSARSPRPRSRRPANGDVKTQPFTRPLVRSRRRC